MTRGLELQNSNLRKIMNYIRSIIAGLAAVLVAALVLPFFAILVPTLKYRPLRGAWDVFNPFFELARWPFAWFLATVVFFSAFYWELENLRRGKR